MIDAKTIDRLLDESLNESVYLPQNQKLLKRLVAPRVELFSDHLSKMSERAAKARIKECVNYVISKEGLTDLGRSPLKPNYKDERIRVKPVSSAQPAPKSPEDFTESRRQETAWLSATRKLQHRRQTNQNG